MRLKMTFRLLCVNTSLNQIVRPIMRLKIQTRKVDDFIAPSTVVSKQNHNRIMTCLKIGRMILMPVDFTRLDKSR